MNTTHPEHLERFLALSARHLGLDSQSHRNTPTSPARKTQPEATPVAPHSTCREPLWGEARA